MATYPEGERVGYAMPAVSPGAPGVPTAQEAFTPAELAAREEALSAAILPGVPDAADPPTCFACGDVCKRGSHLEKIGWHVREHGENGVVEVYCPSCFDRWGWPDE